MRQQGRIMTYLILGTMAAVLLAAFCALMVNTARQIHESLAMEINRQFEYCADQMENLTEKLSEDVSQEDFWWQHLQLLQELSQEVTAEDVVTAGFLVGDQQGQLEFWGDRNMLLATIWKADGSYLHIPVVFPVENSADVAVLFQSSELINLTERGTISMEGYWDGDLFYLRRLALGVSAQQRMNYYESTMEIPEGREEVTYTIYEDSQEYTRLLVRNLVKGYADIWDMSDYAARWEEVDQTLREIKNDYTLLYRLGRESWEVESSAFHTVTMGRVALENPGQSIGSGRAFNYVYVVSFSPLGLALKLLWQNGTLFWLLLIWGGSLAVLLTGCDGLRKAELRSYEDEITRQRQALDYARDAEQSRREMTSAIAHELKTPIAVLSSYAEALQENIDAEKQPHYLSVIREETEKMDRMVLELLDLSRLEAGRYKLKREDFDLEALAKAVIEPLEPEIQSKELKLKWQVGNPTVHADSYRMGQVVENFMTNAIRHTPQGGVITIRIGTQRETFSVENQGKSIAQENLRKVWETFWQGDASRNKRGSGLGLAICRNIVLLHGGSCKAENVPGGVRFSVSLEKEKRLFQQGRMPQEDSLALDYPIAQQYTTVERVFSRLELMSPKRLRQELREGNIRIGTHVVRSKRERLYGGYVLFWREYQITVRLDESDKRSALLMERMRPGGLGDPGRTYAAMFSTGK